MKTNIANIAVCGRFHYHKFAPFLSARQILQHFYYSHKITFRRPFPEAVNLPLKEHLVHAAMSLLPSQWFEPIGHRIGLVWEKELSLRWRYAAIGHFHLCGTVLRLLSDGKLCGVTLGDVVNTHPRNYYTVLKDEFRRLKLPDGMERRRADRLEEELHHAAYLLAPSTNVKNSLVTHGVSEAKIHVIPFGCDFERFRRPASQGRVRRKNGTFQVACVAQVGPRKGQVYLLEAWRKARLPNARLILAGFVDTRMRDAIGPVPENVEICGAVSTNRVREILHSSDLFVLPTLEEGLACSIGEALAAGLPILTTEESGARDLSGVQNAIRYVPSRNAEALARALTELQTHPSSIEQMRLCAESADYEALSWETYSLRLESLYQEICP